MPGGQARVGQSFHNHHRLIKAALVEGYFESGPGLQHEMSRVVLYLLIALILSYIQRKT